MHTESALDPFYSVDMAYSGWELGMTLYLYGLLKYRLLLSNGCYFRMGHCYSTYY